MANELFILDVIGSGFFEEGVTAKSVRDDLQKLNKKERLTVYIDSPGGDVFQGVAIRSQIAQWPSGVDVKVIGLAASAASFIATVGDVVSMAEGSMLMVHDPWTIAVGNSAEMAKAATTLDQIADNLVGAYSKKSGKDADTVRAVMRAETWYSPEAAIEFGLADAKTEEVARAFTIPATFGFKNPPKPAEPPRQRPNGQLARFQRVLDLARQSL
jgi:ATP-dependent Clp protease protease subunit